MKLLKRTLTGQLLIRGGPERGQGLGQGGRAPLLIADAKGYPVLARRKIGKGMLIVASRDLCGHRPDASDPINADWWKPLLVELSAGKPVDPKRRPRNQMPENQTDRDRLPIQYSDYMKPYADAIYGVYDKCFPVIEKVMGVPPSKGMLTKLILLPTGGGGFNPNKKAKII